MKDAAWLLLVFLLFSAKILGAKDALRFRVSLRDKHGVVVGNGQPVFSVRSVERRLKQGIALDTTDLPVYAGYVQTIERKGFPVVSKSRWMNTVVVSASDSSCIDSLTALPFVKDVRLVWVNPAVKSAAMPKPFITRQKFPTDTTSYYGNAWNQVETLGLDALHDAGFKGNGMMIALVDAGFLGVDTMSWFRSLKMVAARDFIYPPNSVFTSHSHGTSVLSLMAASEPYSIVGTAPEASYCLLRSEDIRSEFPIEEDYWTAAVEFADSIGADIVTSSLGYTEFDLAQLSYKKNQLDGKTAFITQAASLASSKGMLIVCSAGNDGQAAWKKISFPADAANVLAVGSVQSDLTKSPFSSFGPSIDGRIKPDVMALGTDASIINGSGKLTMGSGTSFSTPLVAGMAACIWNALPQLKAMALLRAIRESADRYQTPDSLYGYGIPNAQRIWISGKTSLSQAEIPRFYCYPSPAKDKLYLADLSTLDDSVRVILYNSFGEKVMEKSIKGNASFLNVSMLPNSLYLVEFLVSGVRKACQKIIVQK
jgi:subtilisin family serine protease